MGKNVSVYLNDDLIGMVEGTGQPVSRVVQEALKKYFHAENRAFSNQEVLKAAKAIGRADRFKEALSEWQQDRSADRW